jgi:hypothetical protein
MLRASALGCVCGTANVTPLRTTGAAIGSRLAILETRKRKKRTKKFMPSYRVALADKGLQTDGDGNEFTKPISYFAGNLRSARSDAKNEVRSKGCRVEVHVTSERLLVAYERCEQCEGSGKTCHVCSLSKGRCTCATFDPIICKVCSGEGLTTSTN